MASDQAYNQDEPLSVTSVGAGAKPTLSTTLLCSLSVVNEPATLASTQIAHLPLLNNASVSFKTVAGYAGRAVFLQRIDVEIRRSFPLWAIEFGLPLLVEPARPKGVGHGAQQCHVFTPASFASQAHAVLILGRIIELGGKFTQLRPGRFFRHGQARSFEQIGAVVGDGAFAIERQRVEGIVDRKTLADRREDVVDIIVGRQILHGLQPVLGPPQWRLVGADGQHVELATLGGNVGCQALAQHVLFENDPVELDIGILLLEDFRQPAACGSCRRC